MRYPIAQSRFAALITTAGILAYEAMNIEFSNTITAGDIIVIVLTSVPLVLALIGWWRRRYRPITMGVLNNDGLKYVKLRRIYKGTHELKLRLTTRTPLDLNRVDLRFVEPRFWGRTPKDVDTKKNKNSNIERS